MGEDFGRLEAPSGEMVESETARAVAYAFLAGLLLREPGPEARAGRRILEILGEQGGWSELGQALSARLEIGEMVSLIAEYQTLFMVPQPGRYLPPYASVYLDPHRVLWGRGTRQVERWYQEYGWYWEAGGVWRAPDHLGIELAFLATLSRVNVELLAGSGTLVTDAIRRNWSGQEVFLREHLLAWLPVMVQEAKGLSPSFYTDLLLLIEGFLETERLYLQEVG